MYFLTFLVAASIINVEAADSLTAATVTAEKGMVVSMTDTAAVIGSDITETLQTLPGLYVNDYGGISALRSVSIRGLGSTHTAIFIDGIRVNNLQTGQADLGFLDMTSFGSAVVDYAQNSLNFRTARPSFTDGWFNGHARLEGGSFNTWMPSARLDFRLSEKVSLSISGSGAFTDGDFPYGDGQRRENNGLRQTRASADVFGEMYRGKWQAKIYWNNADRTSPGAVSWPSTSRQHDRNIFVQGRMNKRFSDSYSLAVSAKAALDDLDYSDEYSATDYGQKELQLNTAHNFDILEWWKLSLSASAQWNRLESSLYSGSRTSVISALATSFVLERLRADAALEYSGSFEGSGGSINSLSPSLDIRYNVFGDFDIVAFARRAYRVPTFNELYYPGYGNPELKPEDAWLTDLGIVWSGSPRKNWKLSAKLDGFYNILKDKIISAPTESDPSIWLPYNVGRVESAGIDASMSLRWSNGTWNSGITAAYSLQDASDRTPGSSSFGQQISGTPKHSANMSADISRNGWKLTAVWCFRGGRRDSSGELPNWNTLDACISKSLNFAGTELTLGVKARNLNGCRYEIVRDYPAPGRSVMAFLEFNF